MTPADYYTDKIRTRISRLPYKRHQHHWYITKNNFTRIILHADFLDDFISLGSNDFYRVIEYAAYSAFHIQFEPSDIRYYFRLRYQAFDVNHTKYNSDIPYKIYNKQNNICYM